MPQIGRRHCRFSRRLRPSLLWQLLLRLCVGVYQTWYSTSNPTATHKEQYEIAKEDHETLKVNVLAIKNRVTVIEEMMNVKGIPYTPNRENYRED